MTIPTEPTDKTEPTSLLSEKTPLPELMPIPLSDLGPIIGGAMGVNILDTDQIAVLLTDNDEIIRANNPDTLARNMAAAEMYFDGAVAFDEAILRSKRQVEAEAESKRRELTQVGSTIQQQEKMITEYEDSILTNTAKLDERKQSIRPIIEKEIEGNYEATITADRERLVARLTREDTFKRNFLSKTERFQIWDNETTTLFEDSLTQQLLSEIKRGQNFTEYIRKFEQSVTSATRGKIERELVVLIAGNDNVRGSLPSEDRPGNMKNEHLTDLIAYATYLNSRGDIDSSRLFELLSAEMQIPEPTVEAVTNQSFNEKTLKIEKTLIDQAVLARVINDNTVVQLSRERNILRQNQFNAENVRDEATTEYEQIETDTRIVESELDALSRYLDRTDNYLPMSSDPERRIAIAKRSITTLLGADAYKAIEPAINEYFGENGFPASIMYLRNFLTQGVAEGGFPTELGNIRWDKVVSRQGNRGLTEQRRRQFVNEVLPMFLAGSRNYDSETYRNALAIAACKHEDMSRFRPDHYLRKQIAGVVWKHLLTGKTLDRLTANVVSIHDNDTDDSVRERIIASLQRKGVGAFLNGSNTRFFTNDNIRQVQQATQLRYAQQLLLLEDESEAVGTDN